MSNAKPVSLTCPFRACESGRVDEPPAHFLTSVLSLIREKFKELAAAVRLPGKAWEIGGKPGSRPLKTGIVR